MKRHYVTTEQRVRGLGPATLRRMAALVLAGHKFTFDARRGVWWWTAPDGKKEHSDLRSLMGRARYWTERDNVLKQPPATAQAPWRA